jgi:hypothetical protein
MCRNIKKLRNPEHPPTDAELEGAALQFVRKISGYHKPSQANAKAFDRAVRDVARAGRRLFDALELPHDHHHGHGTHDHGDGAHHHHHEAA